jgi:hypothetical protein
MFTPEVYQVDTRWAYAILENGWPIVRQEYHPDKPGHEPMTQAEAEECAAIVLTRVSDPTTQPDVELNKVDFLRLFTQAERIDIRQAATDYPTIADYQAMLDAATTVRQSDPDIQIGIPLLELGGQIGVGRAAQILRNQPP